MRQPRAGQRVFESVRQVAHLCVDRWLLRLQPRALKVLDLVLLVDLVVTLASRAASHVISHAIIPSLLFHARDVGGCSGVKEETEKALNNSY